MKQKQFSLLSVQLGVYAQCMTDAAVNVALHTLCTCCDGCQACKPYAVNQGIQVRVVQINGWIILQQGCQEPLYLPPLNVACVVQIIDAEGNCMPGCLGKGGSSFRMQRECGKGASARGEAE